jgi:hypothetical protein
MMVFVSKTVAVGGASLGFFDFPSKSYSYQLTILKSTIDTIFFAVGSANEYDTFAMSLLFVAEDWKFLH